MARKNLHGGKAVTENNRLLLKSRAFSNVEQNTNGSNRKRIGVVEALASIWKEYSLSKLLMEMLKKKM